MSLIDQMTRNPFKQLISLRQCAPAVFLSSLCIWLISYRSIWNCCSSFLFAVGGLRLNEDLLLLNADVGGLPIFDIGTFLLPRTNELGKLFGGVRLNGEFFRFIRNARSYMIRVPPGVVEYNVPPGVDE